ncbi:MAG: Holliday junction resolvase RuvX [Pseudomonadota bacterium]|nr:Holliday junction resolvase RuvX [Pseudomonadota bacterium]
MVCLCFDFGTFSWGVAVGDRLSQTAQALCAITAVKGKPNWQDMDHVIKQWKPEVFVIGYPLKADGSRFRLTDQVDSAIADLRERYPNTRLCQVDEFLTTVEAKEDLYAKKGKKGLKKGDIDAESAKLILLRWFEEEDLLSDEER